MSGNLQIHFLNPSIWAQMLPPLWSFNILPTPQTSLYSQQLYTLRGSNNPCLNLLQLVVCNLINCKIAWTFVLLEYNIK